MTKSAKEPLKKAVLSVIMPVYNEGNTLLAAVARVEAVVLSGLQKEIIIVDDGSTDFAAKESIESLAGRHTVVHHEKNLGKGSAVRSGLKVAKGDFVVIQDADLEYDPEDWKKMLEPLLDGRADVVYGSRFVSGAPHRVLYFWHSVGNFFLTTLSNAFTNLNLTDMETCYKMFTRKVAEELRLKLVSNRFTIEPEFAARLKKYRIFEVGISYSGRTYAEGKKIKWQDGFAALWAIIRFNLFS